MLLYLLSFLCGYLVGSVPTGYLLVKQQSNVDITKSGSRNVGAFNAGVVTGSKKIGIAVGVLDGIKGVTAIAIVGMLSSEFWVVGVALLASVVGHNYPLWLRFKGGRGLATACGGLLVVAPAYVLVWCTVWSIVKWQRQSILASNILATIATPVILYAIPGAFIEVLVFVPGTAPDVCWLALALGTLFLISHRDGFSELRQNTKS